MSLYPRPSSNPQAAWLMRLGDDALILGHRLSEWTSRAPTLEEDIALSNLALDLIGQTRALYGRACEIEDQGRTEDKLAYWRPEYEFRNHLLVEQPNGDFACTIVRQFIFAAYGVALYERLKNSCDAQTAGIAQRSEREMAYHLRHAGEWLIRLGDGTQESHRRAQDALDDLWPYTGELFIADALDQDVAAQGFGVDPSVLREKFDHVVGDALQRATLQRPKDGYGQRGGKEGLHSEHLGHILTQMQFLQRAYPDAVW